MSSDKAPAYLKIHFAVLLFGITAILGKLIVYSETILVWHRMWISVVGLLLVPGVIRGLRKIGKQDLLRFCGVGVLVALHWITFYGSIKLGNNASITLACLATSTLFTSFLEPAITKSKFQRVEIFLGILVVIGIYLISGVGSFYFSAIIVGLISAFLAALFSVINKKYIANHNTLSVSVVELGSGFLFITVMLPIYHGGLSIEQISLTGDHLISKYPLFGYHIHSFWYMLVLGLLCTSLAYALSLSSLKVLSAFTTNLTINLEPVYGILSAAWIFQEDQDLNASFYIGTAIIVFGVLFHPFLLKVNDKRVKARIIRES